MKVHVYASAEKLAHKEWLCLYEEYIKCIYIYIYIPVLSSRKRFFKSCHRNTRSIVLLNSNGSAKCKSCILSYTIQTNNLSNPAVIVQELADINIDTQIWLCHSHWKWQVMKIKLFNLKLFMCYFLKMFHLNIMKALAMESPNTKCLLFQKCAFKRHCQPWRGVNCHFSKAKADAE